VSPAAEPLDAGALAFDSQAAAAGARQFVANRGPVVAYIGAVKAVPLGSQPIVLDGRQVTAFDPLEKEPQVRAALYNAQYHAQDVAGYLDTLHTWAQGGIRQVVDWPLQPVIRMRDVLAAVPAGGTLSDAQSAEVMNQMATAKLWTEMIAQAVGSVRAGVQRFLGQLGEDHAALVAGPVAVAAAMAAVDNNTKAVALPLVTNPVTAGIGQVIIDVGGRIYARLGAVHAALANALYGHEAMRGGVSALGVAAETIRGKYAAGERALAAADAKTRTLILRKIDLAVAIKSWEQFRDFILNSGF
jgi:hypothetical protein